MNKDDLAKSRVLRGDNLAARQWQPPEMSDPSHTPARPDDVKGKTPQTALPTAAELEQLHEQARSEGYETGRREGVAYGHREGLEEGRRESMQRLERFDQLMHALHAPFEELDDQVERELVALVISMVRQLVRREVKTDQGHIIGVVRDALAVLPVAARSVRLLLHPEDAVLVREVYALGDTEPTWQLVEDPVIQRGGCKVVTDVSQVDATLESRLNALIGPLLAGERNYDGTNPSGD